jgi:SAM-dependent methyltransferase
MPGKDSQAAREWDLWADTYDDTAGLFTKINDSELLQVLSPKGKRALDVGCGTGRFSRLLAADAGEVVGIDSSPTMIDHARKGAPPNARFRVLSVYDLPAEESFDIVAACYLLHHLGPSSVLGVLRRALVPGGMLDILEPLKGGLVDRIRYLVSAFHKFGGRFVLKLVHRRLTSAEWKCHDQDEHLSCFRDFKEEYERSLPGAEIRRVNALFGMTLWRKNH